MPRLLPLSALPEWVSKEDKKSRFWVAEVQELYWTNGSVGQAAHVPRAEASPQHWITSAPREFTPKHSLAFSTVLD